MCDSCGCSEAGAVRVHSRGHDHDHAHGHDHSRGGTEERSVRESALAFNRRFADRNRGFFAGRGWSATNFLSSPGSGKTALLAALMRRMEGCAAVTGDLATDNDARRLRESGAPAVQIETAGACHLDAHAVGHAVERLPAAGIRHLFIENVGNLVCPATFDLGENRRVVLLSVTEGEDKPEKYPVVFAKADAVVVSKLDLADAVAYDREKALAAIRAAAPKAEVFLLSAKTGEGVEAFQRWLETASDGQIAKGI